MIPAAVAPVGTVLPYAGPVNGDGGGSGSGYPDPSSRAYDLHLEQRGWLVCDGRAVPVAKYPELFRAIGFVYGKSGAGKFHLPDYRGRFMRGVNGQAEGPDELLRDPQADQRVLSSAGGWKGNRVGSVQDDALQAHEHNYQMAAAAGTAAQGDPVFGANSAQPTTGLVAPQDYAPPITVRQAPETRVKNVYVNFIIKFTGRPFGLEAPLGAGLGWLEDADLWSP